MPPKKKGKKKSKKTKTAAPLVPEIDRAFYELEIKTLNQKLARLRESHETLETKLEETQAELKKLDEDRADIIEYLNHTLQSKTEEIESLQSTITKMDETKDSEIQVYKDQLDEAHREYKLMRMDLTSENKLLTGKLNAIEEFRGQRNSLMAKFEEQNRKMEEQEQQHKTSLYEVERKFIIGKDVLKKEMENRIVNLASDFQKQTEMRIAATTQRVIRENIALNNEFDLIFDTLKRCEKENLKLRTDDRKLKLTTQLLEEENKSVIEKATVQKRLIKRLSLDHSKKDRKLNDFAQTENKITILHDLLQQSNEKLKQCQIENLKFNQIIELYKCQVYNYETELGNKALDFERILDIVYCCSQIILESLRSNTIKKECLETVLKELERVDYEAPARVQSLASISSANKLPDHDSSYIELPRVRPMKYIRNMQDAEVSVNFNEEVSKLYEETHLSEMEGDEEFDFTVRLEEEDLTKSRKSGTHVTEFSEIEIEGEIYKNSFDSA